MNARTAAFVTLGCKINQYESEAIRQELMELGYREVPFTERADVYVVNACAVTSTASAKTRKYAQRAARVNPRSRVVVIGCSTASDRSGLERIPQVVLLRGTEEKGSVARVVAGDWKPGDPVPTRDVLELEVRRFAGRTRAVVKVQDGCDSFCSFCVIPFLRGRSKSRPVESILEEVQRLVESGYREVVISGVHLEDYGRGRGREHGLADLLERVAAVPGLRRIRLSSLGCSAFGPRLLDVLENPLYCRHWHVPLQSGSDRVLERMRRRYCVASFRATVEELRRRFSEPSISTDVIVGHPGETEADFEETVRLCRDLRFSKVHVFPYSERPGTSSSRMRDRAPGDVVRRRVSELLRIEDEVAREHLERFVGARVEVLVEETRGDGSLEGFSNRYLRTRFDAPSVQAASRFRGTFQEVVVSRVDGRVLFGRWGERHVEAAVPGGRAS